jgi:hypothetical protein
VTEIAFALARRGRLVFWLFVFTVICLCVGCEKTVYPPNFNRKLFESVRVGDRIEDVFNRLGPPLRIYMVSLNPESNPLPDREQYKIIAYEKAVESSRQKERCLILNYSLQAHARRDYYRYELLIEDGRVVEKRSDYVRE